MRRKARGPQPAPALSPCQGLLFAFFTDARRGHPGDAFKFRRQRPILVFDVRFRGYRDIRKRGGRSGPVTRVMTWELVIGFAALLVIAAIAVLVVGILR